MIFEELKLALLNLYCSDNTDPFFEHFWMLEDKVFATTNNVMIVGDETNIVVYFDENLHSPIKPLQYLSKDNTSKEFQTSYSAIEYFKYLLRATKDVRFELYHYFLSMLKKMGIKYSSRSFRYTNNEKLECLVLNLNLSVYEIDKLNVNLFIHIKFFINNTCEMIFIPEEPLWNEGKVCPETQIDRILHYIKALNAYNYKDIPLNET